MSSDIQLINFNPEPHTVDLTVERGESEVVLEETYEMESGEEIIEEDVLGWGRYRMEIVMDDGQGVGLTNVYPRPYCFNLRYRIMMQDGYHADFGLSCS